MKQNIYEIPKIHPFIKTLEKVKELRDNLDEHIEITSQLWEDGKASDAYYYPAEIYHECQKILVNAASLMSCAGNKNAVSDVGKLIKSAAVLYLCLRRYNFYNNLDRLENSRRSFLVIMEGNMSSPPFC